MEKFERLPPTFTGMVLDARLDVMAELANAHSAAIESGAYARLESTRLVAERIGAIEEGLDLGSQRSADMEKFKRFGIRGGKGWDLADAVDTHSDAIEAHADDLESLSSRVRRLERRSRRREGELIAALEEQWGCRIPPKPLQWARTMTAEEAVAIVEAERDKLMDRMSANRLRVWTHAVAAVLVAALREHGREDR